MVNPALKQRLLQEFQQRQQQESLAAQASRAAEPSEDLPRSTGSKGLADPGSPTAVGPHRNGGDVLGLAATADKPQDTAEVQQPRAIQESKLSVPASAPAGKGTAQSLHRKPKQEPEAPLPALGAIKKQRSTELNHSKQQPQPQKKQSANHRPGMKAGTVAGAAALSTQPSLQPQKRKVPEVQADTPVEIIWSSRQKPEPVGRIMASTCASYSELWTAVGRVCGGKVSRAASRLVYQDKEDGDWLMLLPDGPPFNKVAGNVARVMVVVNQNDSKPPGGVVGVS